MTTHCASRLTALAALASIVILATGCATTVKVTSDPPGLPAYIRGSGRASYRWTYLGPTPAECRRRYNAVLTKVVWPDGSQSAEQRTSLIGEQEVSVHFKRPGAAR